MDNRIWKKSFITAAALLVASSKAPVNLFSEFTGGTLVKAGAEKLGEFSADDLDQELTGQESAETMETAVSSFLAEAPDAVSEHNIIIDSNGYGRVSLVSTSKHQFTESAAKNDNVNILATPDAGYVIKDMYLTDENGEKVYLISSDLCVYSFRMPQSDVTLHVEFGEKTSNKEKLNGPIYDTVPEGMVYREVSAAELGLDTDDTYYAPAYVDGVNDKYDYKKGPSWHHLGVRGSSYLNENIDYVCSETDTEEQGDYIVHTLIFTGIGDYKGEMKVTYLENNKANKNMYDLDIKPCEHGTVKAYINGEGDPVTRAKLGSSVVFKAVPDNGYFLNSISLDLVGCGYSGYNTLSEYKGCEFSFGMKEYNAVVNAEFKSTDCTVKTKPEGKIYREVWEFVDGVRTGNKLYIPVDIEDLKDTYEFGKAPAHSTDYAHIPEYKLVASEGSTLNHVTDFRVDDKITKTDDGILHTVTFKGTGMYQGQQVVTYMEKYKSDNAKDVAMSHKIGVGKNDCVRILEEYTFTPEEDGTYRFKLDKPFDIRMQSNITADDGEEPEFYSSSTYQGVVTASLKAGKTYTYTNKLDSYYYEGNFKYTEYDLDVTKVSDHSVKLVSDDHAKLKIQDFNGRIVAGDSVEVDVTPDEGYFVKNLNVKTADNKAVDVRYGYSGWFTMPDSDVTISADVEKVPYENTLFSKADGYPKVTVEGMKDVYYEGKGPDYTVRAADGTILKNGVDFNAGARGERVDGGTRYTAEFTGIGKYAGKQTFVYTIMYGDENSSSTVVTDPPKNKKFDINIDKVEHGSVVAKKWKEDTDLPSREYDKYVDLRIDPDDGYYFKGVKMTVKNPENMTKEIRWYSQSDSFGFYMPPSDVTITPEFGKLSDTVESIPENSLYRTVRIYDDYQTSSKKVYVPVEISGIKEEYSKGEEPEYTLKSSEGHVLVKDTDYTVSEKTEETEDGILHTLTFKGTGIAKKDSEGCFTDYRDFFEGEQTVTYLEKNEADDVLREGSNNIMLNEHYYFTPSEDGVYSFSYKNADGINITTYTESDLDRMLKKDFTLYLEAGRTYHLTGIVANDIENKTVVGLDIKKSETHKVTAAADNCTLTVMGSDNSKQRQIAAEGEIMRIKVSGNEGYTFKSLTVTTAEGKDVKVTPQMDIYVFTMPAGDVTVKAEYEKIKAQDGMYSINGQSSKHGSVETFRYGFDEKVDKRRAGGAVDVKVSPDEGYYLKDIKFVAANGDTVRFYDDDHYGLGFEMPASDITIIPEFSKITTDMSYTEPTEGLYRVAAEYKDGKRTGRKLYIPVAVDIPENGSISGYKVKTADGLELENDVDYKLVIKEGMNGAPEYEFSGMGDHITDGEGYVKGSFNVIKGTRVISAVSEEADKGYTTVRTIGFNGVENTDRVRLESFVLPRVEVEGYEFVGWKVEGYDVTDDDNAALSLMALVHGLDKDATVTVETVYKQKEVIKEDPVTEDNDFTVTYGAAKDQHYTDYSTGGNVFVMDFSFNNLNGSKIKGGVIEFEFDAPVGNFMYGADIGQRKVTVDPTDPRKVTVDFSTYDPNGSSAAALNSYLAISSANKGQTLNCVGARVVSVAQ